MRPMTPRRPVVLLIAFVLCPLLAACGSSFAPGSDDARGHGARPLATIYDFLVTVPGLSFPQLSATGLTVDMTLEIDPNGLDPAGHFEGGITVHEVKVGGVDRPFTAAAPLPATGRAQSSDWTLDSFGPIEVGSPATGVTLVMLSLAGTLSADGRTIDGLSVATSSGETGAFHGVKQRRYLVAATDFGVTGTVSLVRVRFGTQFRVDDDLEAISGDPVARATGGDVDIVNRFFFDNIQSLDPAAGFTTTLQFSTGNGSNPHDVLAVDSTRDYVTRYEPPYNDILIAARADGAPLGSIDLSTLATNASGTPRADSLALADGFVFASMQNIDATFTAYGPGRVAVIDPATDLVKRTITMAGRNPLGPPSVHPVTGDLYYAMAGIFGGTLPRDLSGGIEVIDVKTHTTRGLLVDDDLLGGNVSSVALAHTAAGDFGYCVVTTASGVNRVRVFDPGSGAVAPGAVLESSAFLTEVVSDGDGYILVAAHDISDPRLIVLDAATGLVVAAPRLSLPPFSIAVLTRTLSAN